MSVLYDVRQWTVAALVCCVLHNWWISAACCCLLSCSYALNPFEAPAQGTPAPETLDQLYADLDAEPDPFFAGHELYRALRGDKGADPLADELLWEGDFMLTQREFIQKKQEDELLERLERRLGKQLCGGVLGFGYGEHISTTVAWVRRVNCNCNLECLAAAGK
jgi:hypothetical protein